jgi:hypothetical protein
MFRKRSNHAESSWDIRKRLSGNRMRALGISSVLVVAWQSSWPRSSRRILRRAPQAAN